MSTPTCFGHELLLFCISMGLRCARCDLRYYSISQTFTSKRSSKPPEAPLTLPHPFTSYEQRTHLVVLTTEHKHVESEAYSVRV